MGLFLLAALLAGCTSPEPKATGDDPFASLGSEVTVDAKTGAIAGVVVDEAIRPVGNASVVLVAPPRNTTTDAEGRFAFEGLEPGVYFMQVEARRFEGAQVSVDVVAGEPSTVRILLVALTTAEPYLVTVQFRGRIENYAGFANFVAEVLAPGTIACTCAFDVPVDGNLSMFILEAFGQVALANPGTPATVPGDAYWEVMANGTSGSLRDSAYSEFPIYETFDAEETLEGSGLLGVRITCGVWPCLSMDYDLFVTLFYHEEAPEGWTIVDQT